MVTCSPVDTSTSISRGDGSSVISLARPIRRLVSPLMADTTTTTWLPCCWNLATLAATASIRSTVPTEVPPYFWTISAIKVRRVRSWLKKARYCTSIAPAFHVGRRITLLPPRLLLLPGPHSARPGYCHHPAPCRHDRRPCRPASRTPGAPAHRH